MASFVLNTLSLVPEALAQGETGVITRDGTLLVSSANAIQVTLGVNDFDRVYLSVNGTAQTSGAGGYDVLDFYGANLSMVVGPEGYMQSDSGDAVHVQPNLSFTLTNAGTIIGAVNGVLATVWTDLPVNGFNTRISNHGIIDGRSNGIKVISGSQVTYIVNDGTITGQSGYGIDAFGYYGYFPGGVRLINNGTISGGTLAYRGTDGPDSIYNTGTFNGSVDLGWRNDRYDGALGQVLGVITGQGGNDTIAGGAETDRVSGGDDDDLIVGRGGDDDLSGDAGNDQLLGGDGNDSMSGGGNNDTMNANAGEDTLSGDGGNDILVGQDGADSLDGGTGNDTMDGGNGDDVLEGGDDNDILRGGTGQDSLAGGLGMDMLTGGQDADIFVFRSAAETVMGAMRDQILDFEQGVDLITVAALSPSVFEFKGTAAFAPSGNPELRLFETPTGSTIVQIDVDGDGNADAEIRVANVTGLTADDFAL